MSSKKSGKKWPISTFPDQSQASYNSKDIFMSWVGFQVINRFSTPPVKDMISKMISGKLLTIRATINLF
jgi:hypothetical protein